MSLHRQTLQKYLNQNNFCPYFTFIDPYISSSKLIRGYVFKSLLLILMFSGRHWVEQK